MYMSLKLYGNSKIILGATTDNTGNEVSLGATSVGLDIKRGNEYIASIELDDTSPLRDVDNSLLQEDTHR